MNITIEVAIPVDPSLDEVLLPFGDQVKASGISDAELTDLFATARDEAHFQKNL
jgi:hypothetical protein